MARVKRAMAARKKRQTLVERTKGYYGVRSRTFRGMKEQAQHSGQYAYRDRRNKKREFRALWMVLSLQALSLTGRFSLRLRILTSRHLPTLLRWPRRRLLIR